MQLDWLCLLDQTVPVDISKFSPLGPENNEYSLRLRPRPPNHRKVELDDGREDLYGFHHQRLIGCYGEKYKKKLGGKQNVINTFTLDKLDTMINDPWPTISGILCKPRLHFTLSRRGLS